MAQVDDADARKGRAAVAGTAHQCSALALIGIGPPVSRVSCVTSTRPLLKWTNVCSY